MASHPATTPGAASDLISFLKALPDCRMRRGIRFPQLWMLLVAILSILSGQGSLVGMERFWGYPGFVDRSLGVTP